MFGTSYLGRIYQSIKLWVSPEIDQAALTEEVSGKIDWIRALPFIGMHVACIGVFFVGWSWLALSLAAFLYAVRVFTLTGWYHRYFSHRSFKTWRIVQFFFAVVGCSAVQRGPLWWAAHHRNHHVHSDDPMDLHSPKQQGFWWAHFGWFLTPKAFVTNFKLIPDFAKYPELRFIDRFDLIVPVSLAVGIYSLGAIIDWQTPVGPEPEPNRITGMQLLMWGFFISTIACYHVTYLVNSAAHVFGGRRFATKDTSRNNLIIALLTFGEGWHNNHHHYPNSTRQGFYWWEVDITYYTLYWMSMLGLVWDLKPVPQRILNQAIKPVPAIPDAASTAVQS